ncbi:MAG: 50S ribosomal protein L23 [Candidatus Diapherotrites archaeon CG08_land_8_20_14_0_20_30_16]|nr:MAG: 50S ribosomal protein L23 [Candidatus Diapherotrites archaeon CG08_land_8_20_14_0_20_30_16]
MEHTIFYPLISEKAVSMVETENKIIFIVNPKATKVQVKKAIEETYKVKVDNVNILVDAKGRKRAIVKLNKQFKASELSSKLGMI